ncbi:MAG: hypothetical protein Aurels2KO_10410 [Aureliella sp.]
MRYDCQVCGWPTYGEQAPAAGDCIRCSAGYVPPWEELHTEALVGFGASWYSQWEARAMRGITNCNCRRHWRELKEKHRPPIDGTPDEQFRWAWKVHDLVSERINSDGSGRTRKRITLARAYGIYRKQGQYETDPSYLFDANIDVVIPYCDADRKYAREAIAAILASEHVTPTVHVVYDYPSPAPPAGMWGRSTLSLTECYPSTNLPAGPNVRHYTTPHRYGPYRIANSIAVHHASSKYLALNDADDTSTPDRLWRQLATMQRYGYEMTSGSMVNFVDGDEPALELRRQREGVIESGRSFHHVPNGRCINSIRTMRRETFLDLGGFADAVCSVDFDFDNRAYYAGVPVFWGTDVIGRRRLHGQSLTNGPEFGHRTTNRLQANQRVLDNLATIQAAPNVETARELGGIGAGDRCTAVCRDLVELLESS